MHDHLVCSDVFELHFPLLKRLTCVKALPSFSVIVESCCLNYYYLLIYLLWHSSEVSVMQFIAWPICYKMWLLAFGDVHLSLCWSVLWIVFGRDSKNQKLTCLSLRICLQRHRWKRKCHQKSLQKLRKQRRWAAKQSLEPHHCSHLERHPLRRHSLDYQPCICSSSSSLFLYDLPVCLWMCKCQVIFCNFNIIDVVILWRCMHWQKCLYSHWAAYSFAYPVVFLVLRWQNFWMPNDRRRLGYSFQVYIFRLLRLRQVNEGGFHRCCCWLLF